MVSIYQPARTELWNQIKKYSHFISGRVLDVGAGGVSRYQNLFNCTEYLRMDIFKDAKIDIIGTADSIPVDNSTFNSIVCTQVIGDVFNVNKVFTEFMRVLKPGGRVLLTEAFMDPLHDEPHDYWRFTGYSLGLLAEKACFKIEVLEKRGGFWSVKAQMTIRYLINRFNLYESRLWKFYNILARVYSVRLLWLDHYDRSKASSAFGHGYIMVVTKPN